MLPGLDFRSVGGFVMSPGAVIDGVPYTIVNGCRDIPLLPLFLSRLVGAPTERAPTASEPLTELDTQENLRRAEVWLRDDAPIAVEGQSGDNTTYKVACQIRDFGISEEKALELLSAWNDRCEPPWSNDELETKISNAYQFANDRPGNDTPEGRNTEASQLFTKIIVPTPEFRYLKDVGLRQPQRNWIVNNWIPAGPDKLTLLSGDGGTGKSLLAIQLAMAVSAGEPWIGCSTTQTKTIYISCEDGDDELDERVYQIRNSPERKDFPCIFVPRVGVDNTLCIERGGQTTKGPFYAILDALLLKFPGEKLVILDTIADLYAGDENNRCGVNSFLKNIVVSLGLKHLATMLLLGHIAKKEGSQFSGSTAWNNSVRNRLLLAFQDIKNKGAYRILTHEKSNYSAAGGRKIIRYSGGKFVPVDESVIQTLIDSAIIEAVQAVQDTDARLSLSYQSSRFIGNAGISDEDGKPVPKETIVAAAKRMLKAGTLKIVNADRKSGLTAM